MRQKGCRGVATFDALRTIQLRWRAAEVAVVYRALIEAQWQQTAAARALGCSVPRLRSVVARSPELARRLAKHAHRAGRPKK